LGISVDEPTFVAERAYTDEQTGDSVLYSSILPFSVAEGTPLEDAPFPERPELLATLTDAYGEPEWWEYARARMPQPDETTALNLPDGTPILEAIHILRTGDRPTLAELERRSGAAIQYGYRLTDDGSE
jgi:GntR family transcriptional regulator